MYGAIRSFKGCSAFNDMIKNSKIKDWYENCHKHVKLSKGKDKLNLYASKTIENVNKTSTQEKPKKRFYFF